MSENVENCEENVYEKCFSRDCDCNSSSGGSIYQEIQGRVEECILNSTDDEFMDATETMRSPLLSEDAEAQRSVPILKQLTEGKEHSRYILMSMSLADSELVNDCNETCKENSFEKVSETPSGETMAANNWKMERSKSGRTLRLPSARSLPTAKPDRPARGDGRGPIGASRIPVSRISSSKIKQLTVLEQNNPETEFCQSTTRPNRPPTTPRPPSSLRPSTATRPTTASSKKEPNQEGSGSLEITNSQEETKTEGENTTPTFSTPEISDTPRNEVMSNEKLRSKRSRSQNIDDNTETVTSTQEPLITSTRERIDAKRMRAGSKPLFSRDIQDKKFSKAIAARQSLLKEKLVLMRSQTKEQEKNKQKQMSQCNTTNPPEESSKLKNSQKSIGLIKTVDSNNSSETESSLPKTLGNLVSERNYKKESQNSTPAPSPKPISPVIMSMSITERRRQLRESRERANEDLTAEISKKNADMPEIKPLLFKTNQLKTDVEGLRRKENNPSVPMKTKVDETTLKVKNSLSEKRRLLMKLRAATTEKNGNGDAIQGNKRFEKPSIEALTATEKQKRYLEKRKLDVERDTGNREKDRESLKKQPKIGECQLISGNQWRSLKNQWKPVEEKPTSMNQIPSSGNKTSQNGNHKPPSAHQTTHQKTSGTSPRNTNSDLQVKPLSGSSKVNFTSLQNIYKTNYKRYEELLTEVEKSKKRLCISLGKLDSLRQQMLENYGEDPGEVIPPVDAVQPVVLAAPSINTTTQGMNTDVIEEGIAESFLLLGNNQLRNDNEILKRQLEEAKQLGYSNKNEADIISDLTDRIRDMSLTLKLAEKRQQTLEKKMEEQQEIIVSLKNENQKIADLKRILKQKDQQLINMKKQNEDKKKEVESAQMKAAELSATHDCSIQEELTKRENIHLEFTKVMEERNTLEKQLQDVTVRFVDYEEKEQCLQISLENEKKKVLELEEELNKRDGELNSMENKFLELEMSSSNSFVGLSEQLTAKDAILQQLEILRANIQSQNREMCCLISDIFALKGKIYDPDHIQTALSQGTLPLIKKELLKIIGERIDVNSKALDEAKSKINELQNQVKVLQIELEDSKMMSDRLTNVISYQKSWETDKPWEDKQRPWSSDKFTQVRHPMPNSFSENRIWESMSHRDGDGRSMVPSLPGSLVCSEAAMARNNFNELFVLLEGKRRALIQMERKLHDMEEVHSHCAQKRTRNETRIAQLEMMLATYQG